MTGRPPGGCSRLEQMRAERKDDEYVPELPSVDGAAYLVAYLWDMGPTMVAGMGLGPAHA